jgi:hypothetical protein
LSPGGSTTGGTLSSFTETNGVYTGTLTGAATTIGVPITGSPGSTVSVGLNLLSFTVGSYSYSCTPAGTPSPIVAIEVSGTTLAAKPGGPVAAGTAVTLTATMFTPATFGGAGVSGYGSVQFLDGSGPDATLLGTVNQASSSIASISVANLAPGEHQLTAWWSGTRGVAPNTSNEVDLLVTSAPVVTTQPDDQTVDAGGTVTFTAAASGSPDPTVQWQVSTDGGASWSDISGATSDSYTTPATTAADNDTQYRAVFTNSTSTVTTTAATLTVNSAPVITTGPTSQTVTSGATATFTAAASGNPAPTVQWQQSTDGGSSWSDISGATSTTLSFAATDADNSNQYQAVFTNSVDSATSNAATLTVNDVPTVTTQPQGQSVSAGQSVSFTATGTGKPVPTTQWQVSTDGGTTFADIAGATSGTLTLTPNYSANNDQYRAVFTNRAGVTASDAATLTVVATDGYRLVGADGAVFAFGSAGYYGSMGGKTLNAPIVGMAATPDGAGYWEVASDGGIFAFGDAAFYGSTGAMVLNKPIVGIAATPDGAGYWLVASDGGIFAFGDAAFYGSMGGQSLAAPITGIAAAPGGGGYWLVGTDGGVFTFGSAGFHGAANAPTGQVVAITPTPDGNGYWEAATDGSVYGLGDAQLSGSAAGLALGGPIVGLTT